LSQLEVGCQAAQHRILDVHLGGGLHPVDDHVADAEDLRAINQTETQHSITQAVLTFPSQQQAVTAVLNQRHPVSAETAATPNVAVIRRSSRRLIKRGFGVSNRSGSSR
jgi:hypothetical protein